MAEQGNSGENVRIRLSDSARVEAFSDGVLAIAITLLVFNLQTPDFESGALLDGLLRQWPTYIAYLASFLYLAVIWLNHDALFSRIRYVDLGAKWANIGVLPTCATLPFPTAVLSTALQATDGTDQRAAIGLYALVAALMCVSWEVPTVRVPDVDDGDERIEDIREWRRRKGWNLVVRMTDLLLLRDDGRVLVAEASPRRDAVMVSLPALGAIRRRRRAREAILALVEEILGEGEGRLDRDGSRFVDLVVSIEGRSQLVMSEGLGQPRLLVGMVRAARPFRVVLGLSHALAAALGTAAFTIITDTTWLLAPTASTGGATYC